MDLNIKFCKPCNKGFDKQDYVKHQMTHHSNPNLGGNRKDIPHQFRNNNSISITRIQKEAPVIVQSGTNMQNQNSYKRVATPQAANISRKNNISKKIVVDGTPVGNQVRIRNATSSNKAVASAGDNWQKWDPVQRDRDNGVANIISPLAAERATSAFCNTPQPNPRSGGGSRKGVPELIPVGSSNGKRAAPSTLPASTQRTNAISVGVIRGAANSSPVNDIMKNLTKIKSMNAQANRPIPKKIPVLPQVVASKRQPVQQPLPKQKAQPPLESQPSRVNKVPSQVSKSKQNVTVGNSVSKVVPKPIPPKALPSSHPVDDEMDEDESMEEDEEDNLGTTDDEPPKLHAQKKNFTQTKPTSGSLKPSLPSSGGKIPPQKSLSANRFNPIKNTKTTVSEVPSRNGNTSPNRKQVTNKPSEPEIVVAKKSVPVQKITAKQANNLKKLKVVVPNMPGTSYPMPQLNAIGSYTNRDGEQVWVCLVCKDKESEESSRDMICCDICEDWYHLECVGIFSSIGEDDQWFCKRCIYLASRNVMKDFPKLFKKEELP